MRRDQQRAVPAPQVVLQPLQRAEVEVVRRLVEEQEVRRGDHEPGERRPRLLPARERRRRPRHVRDREAEPGQRLVDALVERVPAETLEPMLEGLVGRLRRPMRVLQRLELDGHRLEVRGAVAHGRSNVRRRHELLVEVGLLGEHPDRHFALARDLPLVRLVQAGGDPHQRRLPGPVRPDQADAIAERDRGIDPVEDHERADLAVHALESQDRHQAAPLVSGAWPRPGAPPRPRGPPRAASPPRASSARRATRRPGRTPAPWEPAARRVEPVGVPSEPSPPPISVQRGPVRIVGAAPAAAPSPAGSRPRQPSPRPAGAGTRCRSASSVPRSRSGAPAGRSGSTARRRAGTPAARPASSRRPRARCSRRSTSRAVPPPPRGCGESRGRAGPRRRAGATPRSAADGAARPTAPRRRRCCRRRRGTSGRAGAASAGPCRAAGRRGSAAP